ncbi:MAG: bifunctional glycosyltransferase family 2/GtrA family protein [Bacillota bacterium]|nr:bifunctional glycosyltransferase family 2/GtrA family protein [Bacillota bacterium]
MRRAKALRKEEAVILIPSLHPDEKLGRYVDDLILNGFSHIVVVDDGSGPDYAHYFDNLKAKKGCVVLGYPENKGKGFALKHGMHYIMQNLSQAPGVITADSDGQHTAHDCLSVAEAMLSSPDQLILGSRDLLKENVPPKSKAGNRLTSFFFKLLYGHWLPDTQTGLRGISRELMMEFIDVSGNRFEYEMNMLIHAAIHNIGFVIVPIDTIYLNENEGTHFHPIRDSWRIYKNLFGNFAKFIASSGLSTLIDILLFTLLDSVLIPALFPGFAENRNYGPVLAATVIARIASALFNYKVNQQYVFRARRSKRSMLRYILLVIAVMFLSATLVNALNVLFGMHKTLAKVIVDSVLFFINYRVSKSWVFAHKLEK